MADIFDFPEPLPKRLFDAEQGLRLLDAFTAIKDPSTREFIVRLAEKAAEGTKHRPDEIPPRKDLHG